MVNIQSFEESVYFFFFCVGGNLTGSLCERDSCFSLSLCENLSHFRGSLHGRSIIFQGLCVCLMAVFSQLCPSELTSLSMRHPQHKDFSLKRKNFSVVRSSFKSIQSLSFAINTIRERGFSVPIQVLISIPESQDQPTFDKKLLHRKIWYFPGSLYQRGCDIVGFLCKRGGNFVGPLCEGGGKIMYYLWAAWSKRGQLCCWGSWLRTTKPRREASQTICPPCWPS